ncbi:MAG: formyltransferase family protein, partial [Candidatus Auribacterota bacterium]|nr:formyltransferase family protein [Candidatus Auribacterota bacterium]
MGIKKKLKICFMGGRQAGLVGALTVLSKGCEILSAVSYSDELTGILEFFGIPVYKSIKDENFVKFASNSDLLLSVHGREIVKQNLLDLPKLGAVNVHPYLYKYKGTNPVGRALADKEFKASVGAHFMTQKVDEGKVLFEEFLDVAGSDSVEEIYNKM